MMEGVQPNVIKPNVNKEGKESCRSCLYTGVAMCAGLSTYFLYLAFEDQPPSKNHQIPNEILSRGIHTQKRSAGLHAVAMKLIQQKSLSKGNRSFHIAFSAAWAIAGIYRLYLN
jgi:hypothetical protein